MKTYEGESIRNVAVIGHSHSGKTSLVSALLYTAGATPKLGLVSDGSTVSDYEDEEIAREMSISSAVALAEWNKNKLMETMEEPQRRATQADPTRGALIIGSSSVFGEALCLDLARSGRDIFGVHFDRRSAQERINGIVENIKAAGRDAVFFNMNAADADKRASAVEKMQEHWAQSGGGHCGEEVFYFLAVGSFFPFVSGGSQDPLTEAPMGISLKRKGK